MKRANQVRSWPSLLAGAVSAAMMHGQNNSQDPSSCCETSDRNDPRQIPRLQITRAEHEDQEREQDHLSNGSVASSEKDHQSKGCEPQEEDQKHGVRQMDRLEQPERPKDVGRGRRQQEFREAAGSRCSVRSPSRTWRERGTAHRRESRRARSARRPPREVFAQGDHPVSQGVFRPEHRPEKDDKWNHRHDLHQHAKREKHGDQDPVTVVPGRQRGHDRQGDEGVIVPTRNETQGHDGVLSRQLLQQTLPQHRVPDGDPVDMRGRGHRATQLRRGS